MLDYLDTSNYISSLFFIRFAGHLLHAPSCQSISGRVGARIERRDESVQDDTPGGERDAGGGTQADGRSSGDALVPE